ncbi:MAG: hypothetical protein LBC88_03055, partial [Spirochaetaceae bacterium]|nr:hypothetical protein [Spirochaetaceae bacterium]
LVAAVKNSTDILSAINDNIKLATKCLVSATIAAAMVQSAKTDYDRNAAIKEASTILNEISQNMSRGK